MVHGKYTAKKKLIKSIKGGLDVLEKRERTYNRPLENYPKRKPLTPVRESKLERTLKRIVLDRKAYCPFPIPSKNAYWISNTKHIGCEITFEEFRRKTLKDGDKVYFERGQVFNIGGYITPANEITFGSYGSGADPLILGSKDLSTAEWTSETGGYYSTPLASAPLWVTKNRRMARQGESDWIPITGVPAANQRTASSTTLNAFNTVQSLVGCKFRGKEFSFRLSHEYVISAYNTGTGTFTFTNTPTIAGLATNYPIKLYGQKQFATQEGDWWWDSANNKLWIKTASTPAGTDIRVVTEDRAFTVDGKSGVTFSGLEFAEYYQEAIYCNDSDTLTISGCNFHDMRTNAVYGKGQSDGITVSGCTISRCGLNGLSFGPIVNFEFYDNTIDEICEQANIGWPIDTTWLKTGGCGIAFSWENGNQPDSGHVHNNSISNVGYMGILLMGDNHLGEYNTVNTFCTKWNDGGGLYFVHRATLGTSTINSIYQYNLVYNGAGNTDGIAGGGSDAIIRAEGIYFDGGTSQCTMRYNVVHSNTSYGGIINFDTEKCSTIGNTFCNNGIAQLEIRQSTNASNSPHFPNTIGNIVTGNTFVALNATQYCLSVENFEGITDYNPFSTGGNCDGNHYIAPYRAAANVYVTSADGAGTAQTLAQWITRYSLDSTSNANQNTLTFYTAGLAEKEIVLVTNPTMSSVNTSSIGSNYIDVSGASISGVQSVPAFGALVYISTITRAYLADTFTGANGTSLAGRSPNVGNVPTFITGTHTIQSNQWSTASADGLGIYNLGVSSYVIELDFVVSTVASAIMRLDMRYVDSVPTTTTRLILDYVNSSTQLRLREFTSGSVSNTWTAAYTLTTGTKRVKVILNGASIKVYVDGVLYIAATTVVTNGNYVAPFSQTTGQKIDNITAYPV